MLSGRRLALYLGMVFLQSLHSELCTLRYGRTDIIEPWLANAERCLLDEEVTLIEDSECDIDDLDRGCNGHAFSNRVGSQARGDSVRPERE